MSRHDGVSCDACLKANFRGRRYKCLTCYDYDLCSECYEGGATTPQHSTDHPMQCILTSHNFELFYGGEALTVDQPQSLSCPFCGKMGYTETSLQEHVTTDHPDTNNEVVCPICASVPGGDPNHVTDEFATHLTLDHRSGAPRDPRDIDENSSNRHSGMQRALQRGRGLGRGVPRRNMNIGSVSGGFFSPSSRESMDPIAELLSQLSGSRRPLTNDLPSSSTSNISPHLSRQQVNSRQQQLERLSRRGNSSSNSTTMVTSINTTSNSQSGAVVSLGSNIPSLVSPYEPSPIVAHSTSRNQPHSHYLLSRLGDNDNSQENSEESRSRSSFVQELLLATVSDLSLLDHLEKDEPPQVNYAEVSTQTAPNPAPPPTPNVPLPSTQVKIPPSVKMSKGKVGGNPPTSISNDALGLLVPGSVSSTGFGVRVRASDAASPSFGRRKPYRVDNRTSQPPPPH